MNQGKVEGHSLLPDDWVDFSLTPVAGVEPSMRESACMARHWWVNRCPSTDPRPWPKAGPEVFAMLGHEGQHLFVLPKQKMIAIRLADDDIGGRMPRNEFLGELVEPEMGRGTNTRPQVALRDHE